MPHDALPSLPIDAILPELLARLRDANALVLQAPPGAGKSTRAPVALLRSGLIDGQILVLEPRRVAARAVAARMAEALGERLGESVGYQVRFERKGSARTRLWVITEGLLARRLQDDPFLDGVGCVILDEFHERSVHADLALAMLREVLDVREDLRLVVMSATLDAEGIAAHLGCDTLTSEGRMHPLTIEHLAQTPSPEDLPAEVARAVRRATGAPDDDGGDILAFLSGRRAIEDSARALRGLAQERDLEVLPLHGGLTLAEQVRALEPGARRRVLLATNIAETSLTVPGVTVVVDSGRVKQLRASAAGGLDQLEEVMISAASATQRAGRAGRVRPGRVYRLWSHAASHTMRAQDEAEIHRVDLTSVALEVIAWSGADPLTFAWYEAPPPRALSRAVALLQRLGAVDASHTITDLGRALLRLPAHPRLGRLLWEAARHGLTREAALAAAMLSEGDPFASPPPNAPPATCDLWARVEALETSSRASASTKDPHGLRLSAPPAHISRLRRVADQLERGAPRVEPAPEALPREDAFRLALMMAYPDRICLRRGDSRDYIMVGGEPVSLAYDSLVRAEGAEVVLALHTGGARRDQDRAAAGITSRALVRLATSIPRAWLAEHAASRLSERVEVSFDPRLARVTARLAQTFDGLVLSTRAASVHEHAPPEQVARCLAEAASLNLPDAFGLSRDDVQWLDRVTFLRAHAPELELPDLRPRVSADDPTPRDPATMAHLTHLCWGCRSFAELAQRPWLGAWRGILSGEQWRRLDAWAPARYTVPSGTAARLQYDADPPVLAVRIQELFGLTTTPAIANGRVPLLLHLLAPNYRPAQITQDLPSFWANTYPQLRKELRARYPKHPWPEDPLSAPAVRK